MLRTLLPAVPRHALRALRRAPGFTVHVVLILGLGLGANAVLFTIVYGLLVQPLPFPEGHRAVIVRAEVQGEVGRLALREIRDLQQHVSALQPLAAFYTTQYNVTGDGPPEALTATICESTLFQVLGLRFLHGGPWPRSHDWRREYDVVLSHGVWTRRFGSDPGIVGRTIVLDTISYRVSGVLAPQSDFPVRADLFRGVTDYNREDVRRYEAVGRLSGGTAPLQGQLDTVSARLAQTYPDANAGVRLTALGLRESYVGAARPYLLAALGAVGLVLLLACGNVVNLQLARLLSRRAQFGLHAALGASLAQVGAQWLAESLLLALTGAVAGIGVAWWGLRAVAVLVPLDLPAWMSIELGAATMSFTVGLAVVVGLLTGLLPAWYAAREDIRARLVSQARTTTSSRADARVRRLLVGVQTAIAVVLLVSGLLMVRTLQALLAIDAGFRPAGVLTLRADPPAGTHGTTAATARFYREALEELRRVPGVTGVASNHNPPMAQATIVSYGLRVEGMPIDEQRAQPFVTIQAVSPGYFDLMGIGLREGRGLTADDREASQPVAVVGARLAAQFWPGVSPVGRRLEIVDHRQPRVVGGDAQPRWVTVVGVANDVRHAHPARPPGFDVYVSHDQFFAGDTFFLVRSAQDPASLALAATAAIQRALPDQSVFDVRPMSDRVRDVVWPQRVAASVLSWLAGLALVLGGWGVFASVAFAVRQHARDFAVMEALGADRRRLLVRASSIGLVPATAGVAAGMAAAIVVVRVIGGLLHGVSAWDPVSWGVAPVVMVALVAVAAMLPARAVLGADITRLLGR